VIDGWFLLVTLALAAASAAPDHPRAAEAETGVVVVAIASGTAGDTAGLRPGDVLLRWSLGGASGPLRTPFDLSAVELEHGPRGRVRVEGRRGPAELTLELVPDVWGLDTRPVLPPAAAAAHEAARRALHVGDLGLADAQLARVRGLAADPPPDLEPWLAIEAARIADARRDPGAVAAAVEEGIRAARAARRPEVEAQLLTFLGWRLRYAERLPEAAAALARALALRRELGAETLATASLGEPIGVVAYAQKGPADERDPIVAGSQAAIERIAPDSMLHARTLAALGWLQGHPKGLASFRRALSLAERLAPDSLQAATIYRAAAWVDPKTERRLELNRRALLIQERLAPDAPETVSALAATGGSLFSTGDAEGAHDLYRRALALAERTLPGSSRHGDVLNNLGTMWMQRGDLARSESYLRQAIEIDERRGAGVGGLAARVLNLGYLLTLRRDFEGAETHLRRALAMAESYSPGGALSGRVLYMLGDVRRARGDRAEAETLLRRALAVVTERSPTQATPARRGLADLLMESERYDEAEALYRESFARVTEPLAIAHAHHPLGVLAMRRGDLDAADRHHRAALEVLRSVASGSTGHAEASHALGQVERTRGRTSEALALFEEAVAALETQGRHLGGSDEERSRFRSHFQEYYRTLEDLLLLLGREREAFEVVERARARGLPALLASRDLSLGADVPARLTIERRQADLAHDRGFRALQAPGLAADERDRLARELGEARRAQEDVRARMRAHAPRLAALRDPEPLDLAGARHAVEPGTLLLVYSLGPGAGRAYAVGPGPDDFAVFAVPAGTDALRREVGRFRDRIDQHRSALGRASVDAASRRLSDLLLRPAAASIARASRLLVVPDGPLSLVPWGALVNPADGRLLVESTAVHAVSSATLYGILARPSERTGPAAVVGFGDPVYAAPPAGDVVGTRARAAGLRLRPLPATRREVAALRSLRDDALLLMGDAATEEKAKVVGRDAAYLHFACHGFLDERFPLESGLALTTPRDPSEGRDNGFLQAWEVLETMRLDADLVTLSACQTGLGEEMAGDGLLGLTWAFQYAGARSVLASLWEVNDASTATLMTGFYRHLAGGVPKAEALRRAQADLLRRRTTSAPYFWAGFTLVGDGR
jgi:CHAT domain-containing protein/tetratricopeptide (TPR) repeat protein